MFKVGDYIVYGSEGVCRVETIGPVPVASMDQSKSYYTLSPVYHTGVIYAPADARVPMRPMLTRDEAFDLIRSVPDIAEAPELPADPKRVAAEYRSCLQANDCKKLLRLIRAVHKKRALAAALGRGFGQTDDRFFKRAKELLYGELALSLGIPVERVEDEIAREAGESAG
ncbi:MAG TPA: CarD family transcriptional regulator [Clostridia bacterium]|nr:CarD family transcriptional regulator [Clostridia bacterium]HPK16278.1 CarD family transcriptional regulator [Clostridia bacterium]